MLERAVLTEAGDHSVPVGYVVIDRAALEKLSHEKIENLAIVPGYVRGEDIAVSWALHAIDDVIPERT